MIPGSGKDEPLQCLRAQLKMYNGSSELRNTCFGPGDYTFNDPSDTWWNRRPLPVVPKP